MVSKTVNCFSNFIVLENFLCINRSFLIDCPKKKIFGNIIFVFTFTLLTTVTIFDIFTSNVDFCNRMFEMCLTVPFLINMITAKLMNNSYNALKILDEKCGIEDEYIKKLVSNCMQCTFFIFVGTAIELLSLTILNVKPAQVLIYTILYSAVDAELIFFSMIANAINLRLSQLTDMSPVFGSKVYRHVLVTIAAINEELSTRVSCFTSFKLSLAFMLYIINVSYFEVY